MIDRHVGEAGCCNMVYQIQQRQIFRISLWLVLVLVAVPPSLALGQTEPIPSVDQDTSAKAKKLMGEGNALFAERDFEGAYQKFLEAWAVKQHIAIASNLVETEMKLGRYGQAAARLRSLLSSMPMDDREERTAFLAQLSECRHHLVSLHIAVNKNGATVKVDGKEVGKSPLDKEVLVEPGQSKVTAELPGYQSAAELTGSSVAGTSKSIKLALEKAVLPQPVVTAPVVSESTSAAAEPPRSGIEARTIVLIGGTTLAAVGAGLGVVYWRMRANTDSEARNLRTSIASSGGCLPGQEVSVTQCAMLLEAGSRYDEQSRLMGGMFIGGGIAAAATLVTYLVWPSGESKSASAGPVKASFLPWSSPNSAGFNVVGQF